MKKYFRFFGMLLATFFLLTGISAEAAADWSSRVITATGTGIAPPDAGSPGQAKIMARIAAKVDAQRQLVEVIKGVQVSAETTVEQMMVTSDTVTTKVSGMLRGAQIVAERELPDGEYEVTMQVPMFGSSGLAEAVFERPAGVVPFPVPATAVRTDGEYTGLVVDCRGLGLNPVMSPVILNSAGTKIYGHQNLDYDLVIRDGMASYASDMNGASRAGNNPLVVRAERLSGNNSNPVIGVTDADKVLSANASNGFLSRTAVVFLF